MSKVLVGGRGCSEIVYDPGGFHTHRCGRRIWEEHPEEGKCRLHHSISVQQRKEKSDKHYEEQFRRSPAGQLVEVARRRDELLEAMKGIYDMTFDVEKGPGKIRLMIKALGVEIK